MKPRSTRYLKWVPVALGFALFALAVHGVGSADKAPPAQRTNDYATVAQPLVKKYCLACHSTELKKGHLDLERFASVDLMRRDLKPWQAVVEMLEAREMPPKDAVTRPTDDERKQLVNWVRGFLNAEALANAGDPGEVPMRRLSNAEYNYTIRDLTGVDLQPAREFPADGAAGEGFTNAAEALTDMSPTLLNKYLNAAKDIADHALLLPDGFRFSPTKTRRDWTDESLARIRKFFAQYTSDGRLPLQPYLLATIRHRGDLAAGKVTLAAVAEQDKLNLKYLETLWKTLTEKERSFPLDRIRSHWSKATEKDTGALLAEITSWQTQLWKFVPIGSYRDRNTIRQVANDPAPAQTQPLKVSLKPIPGQSDVVLYLAANELPTPTKGGYAVWQRPRLEGPNKPPLLLRDYLQFGPQYQLDYPAVFGDTARYLAAAVEAANDRKISSEDLARKHSLSALLLKRWIDVLAVAPFSSDTSDPKEPEKIVPMVPLELLEEKTPKNEQRPAINGWKKKGADLPILITNSSDKTEAVPGRVSPHRVTVHPTPTEFVAAAWKSPVEGQVKVAARIVHAHPACGNGITWWLEHRHDNRAGMLADGNIDVGKEAEFPARTLMVSKGDLVLLAIDPRDGNHACDLTEITFTISEIDKPGRNWDLAADVADTILEGNPHADKHGNKEVWSFVKGPARPAGQPTTGGTIPANSLLGQWRVAAADPKRQTEAAKLAAEVQSLLAGTRPVKDKHPDRILYDNLVSVSSPLFQGLDLSRVEKARPSGSRYGLEKERFGHHPLDKQVEEASLVVPLNTVVEVRLPAALFRDREFVVAGKLDTDSTDRAVQFQVATVPPGPNASWDGKSPIVASPGSAACKQLLQGFADFRRCFPIFICYPRIVPEDEVVCLKLFHREDALLAQLFLNDIQARQLDRLWEEHRFISQWPVTEHKNLPLFIGFVTQDQPKALVEYFEGLREPFRKRAEQFEKEVAAAAPKQLELLIDFAARAWRRPLAEKEKADLLAMYQTIRKKDLSHDEAFRTVLTRVLVSPQFLFRLEQAPSGKVARPVNDHELATRLSYFLWASLPDQELSKVAATGQLHETNVLESQTRRMLKDDRLRALAIEFGTQWIHVRGFDELKEKNEKLFPMFDGKLRQAIYEESILFFQDLFQNDCSVTQLLDADYTYLNEILAKHYGIPGINGSKWRRVEGVKKYGRGGLLGLASVQTKESGASRTSPVLRGNWVVETLLGEKLPRPPKDVPRLPEEEKGNDGLTVRQRVEKHTSVASCAVCHQRIDPFGFAFEKYDPIGRFREKDLGGLAIDTHAKLKDGTEFDGIDGLRNYLLSKKKDVIVRLFCRKLLGYALGRAVTLSDQTLLDEMVTELNKNDGRLTAAVLAIVRSPQFRSIRGSDYGK